jgi:hypothetical protein
MQVEQHAGLMGASREAAARVEAARADLAGLRVALARARYAEREGDGAAKGRVSGSSAVAAALAAADAALADPRLAARASAASTSLAALRARLSAAEATLADSPSLRADVRAGILHLVTALEGLRAAAGAPRLEPLPPAEALGATLTECELCLVAIACRLAR